MKKIIALIILTCMTLTFFACTDNGSKTPENDPPEITLQQVYDAGKDLASLLGDHESVYARVISNGNLIREEYLSKQHFYSFYDAEFMDIGFDYSNFATDQAEYYCFEDAYSFNVMLTPDGRADAKDRFAAVGTAPFVSSGMLDDPASITEKDGYIIVTSTADVDEIAAIGDDVVSCEETYTLDAKTREMTSIKTVYTYKDGTVEEGIVTITRDAQAPEGMKPFLAYAQESENMHTVTFVSNPGTENEKTESVKVPDGMLVGFSPDWDVEEIFTVYADAACTQPFLEGIEANEDITVYIKWGEDEQIPEEDPREAQYVQAYELVETRDYEAAYALFTQLGDYKDAAKEAARFRYVPVSCIGKYSGGNAMPNETTTITLNENNLPAECFISYDDGTQHTCTYTYNANGKLTSIFCTDPEGELTSYESVYNADGKLEKETYRYFDGWNDVYEYSYNAQGKLVKMSIADSYGNHWKYEYSYDESGNMVRIVAEDNEGSSSFDYIYDGNNVLAKIIECDADGHMVSTEEYLYNEQGKLLKIIKMVDGEVSDVTECTYDEKGRLLSEHYHDTEDGYTRSSEYTYTADGRTEKFNVKMPDEFDDTQELTHKLVYVPFEYAEAEWHNIIRMY